MSARAWWQGRQVPALPGYGRRYRQWMRDSLRYIDVQDLATGGDHIPELGAVYVELALAGGAADQGTPEPGRVGGDGAARHTLGEVLGNRSRAVVAIVGPPGSGKSTLLSHAARRGARTGTAWLLGRGRLPVLITLREQAAAIVADPAVSLPAIARAAAAGAADREPEGWWERRLRGRCLVLLDGLDEVARAEDRSVVAQWVERQIAAHAACDFVVTSRSFGLPDSLAAQAEVFVVRPLAAEQVQLFLDRWCLAAEQHATGASGPGARRAMRMRAQESSAKLFALLKEHPALHELAVNPLLLTMIAAAHRYRGALPGSRADLYGEICQVLLTRRGQAKGLPELLPWPAKQSLLAALAYRMMFDHAVDLPADRVLELVGPGLERFPESVSGQAFLDDVSRNGLLVETAPGRHAFAHLTFQEYLAARHIVANPALVATLAANVSDPWWHEATLLYAAAADASPVVRACLDSGTIPALTLAFDCAEASTEIDPELRQRLNRERAQAYEPDCSPEHRRLIAGVQAARLVRRTVTTAAGARICAQPVPADLYWLFLQDTGAAQPDSPCVPGAGEPATGIWGGEARAFVSWLNAITAKGAGIEVRLPRRDELDQEPVAGALAPELPDTVTSAWTEERAGLWLRPGQPHPHELPGAALVQAVAADAERAGLVAQGLTAAVLDVALRIARDLDDVRALSGALATDLAARARSEGEIVDLMHAHASAIVLSYAHALDLTRAVAVTVGRAAGGAPPGEAGVLEPARGIAEPVAGELAEAIGLARGRAIELAEAIDLDLNVLSAFDFDLARVLELARAHAVVLDRAYALACAIPHDAEPRLAGILGLPASYTMDPAVAVPGLLRLPLRWVAEGPLAAAALSVLSAVPGQAGQEPGRDLAFARALCTRAGVGDGALAADLSGSLTDQLRDLAAQATADDWAQATGTRQLGRACAPLLGTHQPPAPPEAAALRAVALALAVGSQVPGGAVPGDTAPGGRAAGGTGSGGTPSGKKAPGSTGPGSTGPGSTGPGSTGPGSTGPGSTGPGSTGLGSTGPGSTGLGSTGPKGTGAAGAVPAGAAGVLRTVAATVTLIERRARGEAVAGESIILALG